MAIIRNFNQINLALENVESLEDHEDTDEQEDVDDEVHLS